MAQTMQKLLHALRSDSLMGDQLNKKKNTQETKKCKNNYSCINETTHTQEVCEHAQRQQPIRMLGMFTMVTITVHSNCNYKNHVSTFKGLDEQFSQLVKI